MKPNEPQLNTKKFFIIGAISLVLLYGVNPIVKVLGLNQVQYSDEVIDYAAGIETYTPESMRRLIASSDKPVMLHLFASWCPYCQQQNPIINELVKDNPKMPARVVSVDSDINALAQYLMSKKELFYTPYHMHKDDYDSWLELLKEYGIDYQGNIPFTVFLGKDKKLVAQFRGVVDKATLTQAIASKE